MTDPGPTHREVRDANLQVYRRIGFDEYERNPSIFERGRQEAIREVLSAIAPPGALGSLLDIGTGTGNVLRLAQGLYGRRVGMDLSERLLAELAARHGGLLLVAGEGDHLPFPDGRFDAVAAYGVLHHLVEHGALFREVARVLRPGGAFYTDHDPNYYLGRFYRVLYRLRYRNRHGFGDRVTDLSEYHHSQTAGLAADRLAAELRAAGFSSVEVRYRMTTSAGLSRLYRAIRAALRAAAAVYPARSFYTHFYMLARRAH